MGGKLLIEWACEGAWQQADGAGQGAVQPSQFLRNSLVSTLTRV